MQSLFQQPGEPPQPPPRSPDDSVSRGVGLAIVCQVCCIVLLLFLSFVTARSFASTLTPLFVTATAWGLIQWIVLAPVAFAQTKRGNSLTVKGILIAGSLGFLLNAGCDALLWWPLRH